jgi:hypothetical protein
MKKILVAIGLLALSSLGACKPDEVPPTAAAEANFEYVWREFDQLYGGFEVKPVDWAEVHGRYRAQLTAQSGNADLYRVLTRMIDELNDGHVSLAPTEPQFPRYVSGQGRGPALNHTSLDLIKERYLTESHLASPTITYGKLAGNVGYIYLSGLDEDFRNYERNFDLILAALKDTKGLVLDLRDNSGGRDELGQYVAGRFAEARRLYMKSRKRNGPRHEQFTSWQEWYVQPTGPRQYTKPVAVLTSDDTFSAGETLLLALKRLPHVRQVGIASYGAFSDRVERDMPNGWRFTVSVGEYRDHNGVSWEGRGLTPDEVVTNTAADLAAGRDPQLARALQLVQ